MKELLKYSIQAGRYQDSFGICIVELEGSETINDVREKYYNPQRKWYETQYSNAVATNEYYDKQTKRTFEGNLVILNVRDEYTG